MRNFRIFFLIVFYCFIYFTIIGQPDSNLLPPSPTASSLGVYNQLPVGLFTGTVQFNIPIYSIKTKEVDIPISLSYSSNGIRVDELPSIVGIGWCLNVGGVITRSVNDELDNLDNRVTFPNCEISSSEMSDTIESYYKNAGSDIQPDIFGFNFPGYSGKFFLDKNLKAVLINPSPIKIEVFNGFDSDINELAFMITTPDGLKYYFGNNGAFEKTYTVQANVPQGSPHINGPNKTAWYLTTIELLNGDEVILEYDTISLTYDVGLSQTVRATKDCSSEYVTDCIMHPATHTQPQYTFTKIIASKRLQKITWTDGVVNFAYSNMFSSNGVGSFGFTKLDSITVYDLENDLIKKSKFDYKIFPSNFIFKNNDLDIYDQNLVNTHRLLLEKVIDITGNENVINPYIFEYYSPWKMAPRLSYSQDYWGYFNGKYNHDFVTGDLTNYVSVLYNNPLPNITTLFSAIEGDKNPCWQFGIYGLLKRITYPTMGSTILTYEPHTVRAVGQIFPDPVYIELRIDSGPEYSGWIRDTCSTGIIQTTQEHVPVSFNLWYTQGCEDIPPPPHDKMTISCRDAQTNQQVCFHTFSKTAGCYVDIGELGSASIQISTSYNQYKSNCYIKLEEGHSYIFEIAICKPCLSGFLSLNYYRDLIQNIMINKEIGGLRVTKTVNCDNSGNETIKKYYYSFPDSLECSSGKMENLRPAISFFQSSTVYFDNDNRLIETEKTDAILSSGSLNPIYNLQGNYISYNSVIEGFGENFEGGAIAHNFYLEFDSIPDQWGDLIPGTPFTNVFQNGFEWKQTYYSRSTIGEFNPIKTLENENYHDNRLDLAWEGFNAAMRETRQGTYFQSFYNINTYNLNAQWHYINQTIQRDYDENGNNPISKVTNYYYDNEVHMQLSREKTVDSEGDTILVKNYYPDDVDGINALPGGTLTTTEYAAVDSLKTIHRHRISEPVQTETYKNGEKIFTKRINYKLWGDFIWPESIESAIGNSPLKTDLIYYQYDSKGNPIELGKPNGHHIAYLWGYNYSLPIIKVENASFQEVVDATGLNYEQLQTLTGNELIEIGSKVREQYSNETRLVYTYTYDPLVGMVNATDPAGVMTSYTYDNYRRLTNILDPDLNIIKHLEYNFKKYLLCSPSDFSYNYTGGIDTIEVITNLNNEVNIQPSVSWFEINQTSQNNIYTITCDENNTYDDRNGEFTLICDSLNFTCPVTQSCAPYVTMNPDNVSFGEDADSIQISVTSNVHWFANESVPWLVISPSQSGNNNGNFKIHCSENTSIQPRETDVHVTGGGIMDSIIVSQEGIDYLNVSPDTLYVEFPSGDDEIEVSSNLSWDVTFIFNEHDDPWITQGETNDDSFIIHYEENRGEQERQCDIVISVPGLTEVVTVIQAGHGE